MAFLIAIFVVGVPVSVRAEAGSPSACSTGVPYGPDAPVVTPHAFFSGKAVSVSVMSEVSPHPALMKDSVTLIRVDREGRELAVLGKLYDPEGAGQFIGQFTLNEAVAGQLILAVRANYSRNFVRNGCLRSEAVPVDVVQRPKPAKFLMLDNAASSPTAKSLTESAVCPAGEDWGPDQPAVAPSGIFSNEDSLVTVTSRIMPDPNLIPSSVMLVRADAQGKELAMLGRMYDDGTHGDVRAGDGEYTGQVTLKEPDEGQIFLRVRVLYQNTPLPPQSKIANELRVIDPSYHSSPQCRQSKLRQVDVIARPSDAALHEALQTEQEIEQFLQSVRAKRGDNDAQKAAVSFALKQPGVVGVATDYMPSRIWVKYDAGFQSLTYVDPPNPKSDPWWAFPNGRPLIVPFAANPGMEFVYVSGMKLFAPNVGWALVSEAEGAPHHLMWTNDGGATWSDITPHSRKYSSLDIADVFFLDTKRGWVLLLPQNVVCESDRPRFVRVSANMQLACAGGSQPKEFALAFTIDGGVTWSFPRVTINGSDLESGKITPFGRIGFIDPVHGWMNLIREGRHGTCLFVTSDGGRTWQLTATPEEQFGDVLMVTPMMGWAITWGRNDQLYVTRDGTRSWQKVSLEAPKEIEPAAEPLNELPTFQDSKHGFVAVTYAGGLKARSANLALVLFGTDDGGRTWKPVRIVRGLKFSAVLGERVASAIVDSTWIVPQLTVDAEQPVLRQIPLGTDFKDNGTSENWHRSGNFWISQFSFINPTQGWIAASPERLFSTIDGGADWTPITPRLSK
ncbi:MAG TPA: choice-of-anchor X domain-containing protein [Candidatus Binataceae bacterium]|nr:choice-of-anchor X domain-containing protein [Candidatus Binataceae bacterium]